MSIYLHLCIYICTYIHRHIYILCISCLCTTFTYIYLYIIDVYIYIHVCWRRPCSNSDDYIVVQRPKFLGSVWMWNCRHLLSTRVPSEAFHHHGPMKAPVSFVAPIYTMKPPNHTLRPKTSIWKQPAKVNQNDNPLRAPTSPGIILVDQLHPCRTNCWQLLGKSSRHVGMWSTMCVYVRSNIDM